MHWARFQGPLRGRFLGQLAGYANFYGPQVHALVLLRRRLQGLFERSFELEVRSEIAGGTTVTIRMPLRKRPGVNPESPRAITSEVSELSPS